MQNVHLLPELKHYIPELWKFICLLAVCAMMR